MPPSPFTPSLAQLYQMINEHMKWSWKNPASLGRVTEVNFSIEIIRKGHRQYHLGIKLIEISVVFHRPRIRSCIILLTSHRGKTFLWLSNALAQMVVSFLQFTSHALVLWTMQLTAYLVDFHRLPINISQSVQAAEMIDRLHDKTKNPCHSFIIA